MKTTAVRRRIDASSYSSKYKSLIAYANEYRRVAKHQDALAGLAILKIRELRKKNSSTSNADEPMLGHAYIIRQFKRPEEIETMRRVYGRKFIQVSLYGSADDRRRTIIGKIKSYDASPKKDSDCETEAIELIDIDNNQAEEPNGQRVSEVFHLGDVFLDGIREDRTTSRFIDALFGKNTVSPTKDEYGLYIATAASLRSVDLSRQVGAAIFTDKGELISMGCNEVPKYGGGTYWTDDSGPKFRDIDLGYDANQERKNQIVFDFLGRLEEEGLLRLTTNQRRLKQAAFLGITSRKKISEAQLMDIIEFGRMVHAEMSAISDAARLGRAIAKATLYTTTFPCHLCTKHIVASGINRVVFLEPYPKSYAQQLHDDSITFTKADQNKVLFEPFLGISPRRYRDIFEKKKRKDDQGKALTWYEGNRPVPMIEDRSASYIENEAGVVQATLQGIKTRTRKAS
jgi:deoxycytidylate deaminase